MANTVPVLNFTNTFGDLLSAQNRSAIELNNLGANNYTKDAGTLFLNGSGTGLSVTNAGLFGSAVVSGVLSVGSSISALANVFINGAGNGLEVANNTLLRGSLVTNQINANTLIRTTTLNATGNVFANDISSNNLIRTTTLNAQGNVFVNNLQSNGAIFGASANIVGLTVTNSLVSNTSITGSTFYLSNDGIIDGSLSVGGDFIIDGTTVYNTNTFIINANSSIGAISIFGVNRGTSGANAAIRWNENQDYWDIIDVNNPSSYSKILTANLISNSISSISTDTVASSLAANTLNNALQANVISLQSQITANVNLIGVINAAQNTTINNVNFYAQTAFARANTSVNTLLGTLGIATANGGVVSFSSNNGVIVSGSSNTVTISTPQDLRTTSSPTFNGLTLTNPLAIAQGGTSATNSGQALTNILPTGTTSGYVLTTGGPGSFYWAAVGATSTIPGTTISSTRLTYVANGTGLAYTTPTYVPGASQLRVYIDGVRQFPSTYTETSNTVVTFAISPPSGTTILMEVDGYVVNPFFANTTVFTPNATISPTANTVQLAIDTFVSLAAFKSGAVFSGPIQAPTPLTATSNTQVATTAFVNNLLNAGGTFTHSITGNAGTVTNGVVTTGSYADPAWITSLAASKSGLGTGNNVQFNSLGVGTAGSGTAGEIRATNNITAYYSDDRLKNRIGAIENALDKLMTLSGFYYEANDTAQALGYTVKKEVGLSAQEVQKVLPEVVVPAPIDEKYLTIHYERVIPLLVEAIKELKVEIDAIKGNNK